MRIKKVILEDFRSFYGKVEVSLDDLTVFIGKNDVGKSSILEGIDIFINEGKGSVSIDDNDLNQRAKNEGKEVFKIGIVFKDIPNNIIIDSTNPTNLKDEYLLNKDGDLEIWKTFKRGKVQGTFIKCYHPVNDNFLKNLMHKKISDLQKFIDEAKISNANIDKRKSADLRKIIREFYIKNDGRLNFEEIELEINSEGLKDIWSQLQRYLPIYSLFRSDRKNIDQDDEIQDPLKARIEQIFKREHIQNRLNEIANEINKEISEIAQAIMEKFKLLNGNSVNITLSPDIPEVNSLKWKDVYKGLGFVTNDNIPLNKRGSEIRRLVLLSSFLAEVERKNTENINHTIYAIEEPETALHPDLQIKFINTLQKLSTEPEYQILINTHSPELIRLFETSNIRYVEQKHMISKVINWNENVANKIIKDLGLLPNIGKVVICVEGANDEAFLLNINESIDELKSIINLKEKIQTGVVSIIPLGGSRLKDWINREILKNTNAMEFHLYDRDNDEKYKKDIEKVNKRGNGSFACLTNKREIENYIPKHIIEEEFEIKLDNIDNSKWDTEDIPKKIKEKCSNLKEGDIKSRLCGKASKKITKEDLIELGAFEEIKGWFEKIREMVDKALISEKS
jgi:predicted ATP-dependent endonuclease of OLD family